MYILFYSSNVWISISTQPSGKMLDCQTSSGQSRSRDISLVQHTWLKSSPDCHQGLHVSVHDWSIKAWCVGAGKHPKQSTQWVLSTPSTLRTGWKLNPTFLQFSLLFLARSFMSQTQQYQKNIRETQIDKASLYIENTPSHNCSGLEDMTERDRERICCFSKIDLLWPSLSLGLRVSLPRTKHLKDANNPFWEKKSLQ